MNEIKELEEHVGANAICISDYGQNQYTFSIGAIKEINKAFDVLNTELAGYREAEQDGRLVVLPISIGSTVYCIYEKENKCLYFHNGCEENCDDCDSHKQEHEIKEEKFRLRDMDYLNKFIFLTSEAAEAAIQRDNPEKGE